MPVPVENMDEEKKNTNFCNESIGSLLWGIPEYYELKKIFLTKPQLSTDPQFFNYLCAKFPLFAFHDVYKKGHIRWLPVLPYFRGKKEK